MDGTSQNNKWLASTLLLLCVIILVGYVTELPFMMNYLEVSAFWRLGLLMGSILGIITGGLAVRKLALSEEVARLRVFFMGFFFSIITVPLILSWSNRMLPSPPIPTSIIIESELARYGDRFGNVKNRTNTPTTYVLFFLLDQQLYRISAQKAFFPDAEAGDQVTLNISQGRWGYRWVEHSD
jgi:hypothetical protein